METTKTELHTHLMGMLSARDFLEFISSFGFDSITFPSNRQEELIRDIINDNVYLEQLSIPEFTQVDYFKLNTLYSYRNVIFKELISKYRDREGINYKSAETYIVNEYINTCLRDLVRQGVEYVEISYSFSSRIIKFVIDDDLKDKIKCKFLLSTSRSNPVYKDSSVSSNSFEASAKDLEKVLKSGNSVGFDIMGEEIPMTLDELDPNNSLHSFKKKLEILLDVLNGRDGTTLRIHSGETPTSFSNTNNVLRMLEEVANEKGYVIPPPEIRIGHGLYFEDTTEYVRLLQKFGCVIEINASSNLALSNIKDFLNIPYKYYHDNNIPIVISTDGHGLYSTSIEKEDAIAYLLGGKEVYDDVLIKDNDIIARRGL